MQRMGRRGTAISLAIVTLACGSHAWGQLPGDSFQLGVAAKPRSSVAVAATLTRAADTQDEAILAITITLPPGVTTYGQDSLAVKKTDIQIGESVGLTPIDEAFSTDRLPEIEFEEALDQKVSKYHDSVTFSRRYRIEPGAAANVKGKIDFLMCDAESCTPKLLSFAASAAPQTGAIQAPTAAPVAAAAPAVIQDDPLRWGYRLVPTRRLNGKPVPDPVRVQFVLAPPNAAEGAVVTLTVSMELDPHWHTYSLHPGQNQIENPTKIDLTEIEGLNPDGDWSESPQPEIRKTIEGESRAFSQRVSWSKDFKRTSAPVMRIAGDLTYQICEDDAQCKPEKSLPFALGPEQPSELLKDAQPAAAAGLTVVDSAPTYEVANPDQSLSLLAVLGLAFIGGLTLNIMPCVLPVLAIKILSFVQQAGEKRGRIFWLNLVYTLGVVSVFWLLASLAAFAKLSWGGLFHEEWFRVSMVLLLFILGLNMLGVFEIVLPGLVNQAAGAGHREGLFGAFLTGIFATLLATPCSTAYMGSAVAWSLKQPVAMIYLAWTVMGLGMALPYLLVGIFPKLIVWLPRPGMWMVRFKQLSAFALFAAAAYFMGSVDHFDIVPVLYSAVGLSLGLWMVGTLYHRETPFLKKSVIRIVALLLGGGASLYAWSLHTEATGLLAHELPWKKFKEDTFIELRMAGRPMIVDFTANWCLICKTNEKYALNTERTAQFVQEHEIVTLVGDWTNQNDEIRKWLNKFDRDSVPLTLIVPPNPKAKLIALSGLYSQRELLGHLREAMKDSAPAQVATAAPGPVSIASSKNGDAE